jgi:hypothetical protein
VDEGSDSASQFFPTTFSTSCSHACSEHTETSSSRGLCSLLVSGLGEDISAARENLMDGRAELLQSRLYSHWHSRGHVAHNPVSNQC